MGTLIVGANGATGRLLVEELLKRGQTVKIVLRSLDSRCCQTKPNTSQSATIT